MTTKAIEQYIMRVIFTLLDYRLKDYRLKDYRLKDYRLKKKNSYAISKSYF